MPSNREVSYRDVDGDGTIDRVITRDRDGDGTVDVTRTDYDNDGTIDDVVRTPRDGRSDNESQDDESTLEDLLNKWLNAEEFDPESLDGPLRVGDEIRVVSPDDEGVVELDESAVATSSDLLGPWDLPGKIDLDLDGDTMLHDSSEEAEERAEAEAEAREEAEEEEEIDPEFGVGAYASDDAEDAAWIVVADESEAPDDSLVHPLENDELSKFDEAAVALEMGAADESDVFESLDADLELLGE